MTGAVINPVTRTVDMPTSQTPSMPNMNSLRISAVVDRLLVYIRGGLRNDRNEFSKLCISLSRAIDCAVANKELPLKAPELPGLLKQVCQWKNDAPLQAVIMVLLISIKGACRSGWFNEKDKQELQSLSDEISRSFCSVKDMNIGENTFHNSISAVMLRFYPSMKMGETLAFVEANLGYGAFVKDFDITKEAMSCNDKIYLFVAQVDDTETSSCIISPQQVNFLLNGKSVDGRTCISKDSGPQNPTPVTHMLKLGTNLLQVVGQFTGKYIIIVGFMSMVSNPNSPIIPNYVPPTTTTPDSDNDLIEGASTVSLNCPISFKRIKTPIKGQLCKHRQCFDYGNYVDINSRRPSWKCPHCSQSVCFTDIRIDRIMVKVLDEVGGNVSHVKICADESWEAVNEGTDSEQPPLPQQSTSSIDTEILNLSDDGNDVNAPTRTEEIVDKKPSPDQLQNQPNKVTNPINQTTPTSLNTNNSIRDRNMENRFQRINLPNRTPPNTTSPPVMNQISTPNSERSRGPRVTRIPIAVQALPAAGPTNSTQQQQRVDRFHMPQYLGPHPQVTPPQQQGSGYRYNQVDSFNLHQHQATYQGLINGLANNHHLAMSAALNVPITNQQHYAMSPPPPQQQPVHVSTWTPPALSSEQHGEQNWRPSGRMRGSLSGQAYSDAINQFMYYPTQPIQATTPPNLNNPRPVIPPNLQLVYDRNMMMGAQGGENFLRFDNVNGGNGGGFR